MISLDVLLPIAAVLVALTNIITQVIKQVTYDKLPTNILAIIISMVITVITGFAWCQIEAITITWYLVIAIIVAGFVVAYAAMFGFDKLKELVNQWTGIQAIKAKEAEKDV